MNFAESIDAFVDRSPIHNPEIFIRFKVENEIKIKFDAWFHKLNLLSVQQITPAGSKIYFRFHKRESEKNVRCTVIKISFCEYRHLIAYFYWNLIYIFEQFSWAN